jgi:hypothetical protein
MNLSQLFQYVSDHPWPATAYFLLLPFVVWIVGLVASGSRNVKLWSYIYAILVYAVCIPGVFAVTLNMYLFYLKDKYLANQCHSTVFADYHDGNFPNFD